jgi:FixJ family two-component response regulator
VFVAAAAAGQAMPELPIVSIVDDDLQAREAIEELVLSLGYKAVAFESADHFLASDHVRKTACLIADIQMPGRSGLDLQDHLVANGHSMPIIFITAFPEERFRTRAMTAGAVCFLNKPFLEESLVACLQSALTGPGRCVN